MIEIPDSNQNPDIAASLSGKRQIDAGYAGQRLDQVLVALYPELSRSRLQTLLKQGDLQMTGVDGQPLTASASMRVLGGEVAELTVLPPAANAEVTAQPIDLDVVYADQHLFVINKTAGLVMHPAAGNPDGTVQNGLLHLDPGLAVVPRAGIVHRLDKDTTGLFVVARTLKAHASLVAQLQERTMGREYHAIAHGDILVGGTVDQPIGRHPRDRLRMAVNVAGKPAVTHYRVEQHFGVATLLAVKLESGRTHQIRVHMAWLGHPLIGDPLYGGKRQVPKYVARPGRSEESDAKAPIGETVRTSLAEFPRQALHAKRLSLIHPDTHEAVEWNSPVPAELLELQRLLDTQIE